MKKSFKDYITPVSEETTAADAGASIPPDTKIERTRRHKKHSEHGHKCKQHKKINCEICSEESWGDELI